MVVITAAALTVPATHPVSAKAQAVPTTTQPAVTALGNGAWSWFGDPRAVRVTGQRDQDVVGWIDTHGGVTVEAIDRRTGQQQKVVLGHLPEDDHSDPSLLVEPDKRITAFYSGHSGKHMVYRTTVRPEDVSAWGPRHTLTSNTPGRLGYTYPNPVMLPSEDNRLWLFWRGGNWEPTFATRSSDGHWSSAKGLIGSPGRQRPYLKVASNGRDRIALAFTDGHPRDVQSSIYYAEYRHGELWTASGKSLGRPGALPIHPSHAEIVYDAKSSGVRAWVHDVAYDAQGRPVIVFATFPSKANHEYWYARWTGGRWDLHQIVGAGPSISDAERLNSPGRAPNHAEQQYSPGIVLDPKDPSVVLLSRKIGSTRQVERWTTPDGGSSWQHQALTDGAGVDSIRPVVVREAANATGRSSDVAWLSGRYGAWWDYGTKVVLERGGL